MVNGGDVEIDGDLFECMNDLWGLVEIGDWSGFVVVF
jgi:hypothetical protein